MRRISSLHPTESVPVSADSVMSFVMTGGSSAQASDWLSSGSTAVPSASIAQVHIARVVGCTTAGAPLVFAANFGSTAAYIGSSGSSVSSSGVTHLINGDGTFQIPSDSTGFSFASLIPGYISVEQWRR